MALAHNAISLSPYTPPKNNLKFELGFDTSQAVVGENSVVAPTDYNLVFGTDLVSSANVGLAFGQISNAVASFSETNYDLIFDNPNISSTNYDIVLAPVFTTFSFSNSWDFAAAFHDSHVTRIELTTSQVFEFNLDVCGAPYGQSIIESPLEFIFDDFPIHCAFDFEFEPGFHGAVTRVNTLVFDKNLNIDISPCSLDINPAVDVIPHNFDFTLGCDLRIVEVIHGASVTIGLIEATDTGEMFGYHGAHSDSTLVTQILFNPVPMLHGATSIGDIEVFPPALLDSALFHGAFSDANLRVFAQFQLDAVYHGTTSIGDIEVFPPALLDSALFHGAFSDANLQAAIQFSPEILHGTFSDVDLRIFARFQLDDTLHGATSVFDLATYPPVILELDDTLHGAVGASDLALSVLFPLDDTLHGVVGVSDLALSVLLILNSALHGADVVFDLELAPAAELTPDNILHGHVVNDVDLVGEQVFYPRGHHGAHSDIDITIPPPIEFELVSHHGAEIHDPIITNADFNFRQLHGARIDLETINTSASFPLNPALHGVFSDVADLNRAASLDASALHGAFSDSDLEQKFGEEFLLNSALNGIYADSNVKTLESTSFAPFGIHTGARAYDGLGGYGGINHCHVPSTLFSKFIIMGYGDFDISYDTYSSDDAWSKCAGRAAAHFDTELSIAVSLEFEPMYSGASVHMYIPFQRTALTHNVDIVSLYSTEFTLFLPRTVDFDLDPIVSGAYGECWFNGIDDIFIFTGPHFEVTLTEMPFAQGYHGATITDFELDVEEAIWRDDIPRISHGARCYTGLSSFEHTRFCRGYIIPTGVSVVFEYSLGNVYDCESVISSHGAHAMSELSLNQQYYPTPVFTGATMRTVVIFDPPFDLEAHLGQHAGVLSFSTKSTFDLVGPGFTAGAVCSFTFKVIPDNAYHGAIAVIDDISVPGPGIQWVTSADDSLPNEYIPLDDNGFPLLELTLPDENGVVQILPHAIEELQYRTKLEAECVIIDPFEGL